LEALHVPPELHLSRPTPEGQGVRVAVGRHELGARIPAPGCIRNRGASGRGLGKGEGGGGICTCDPSRKSSRKAHVLPTTWGLA